MRKIYRSIFRLGFLMLGFCLSTHLSAQRTISGTVTDASTGETLIGANVFVKDANTGTVTDFDGYFSLVVPEGYDIVTFSYTGYQAVEVTLTAENVVNIDLSPGRVLDEIVVIGYGTVKREDATGSLQSVSSESFNRGAITGPQELLAGKIAGVVISTNSGAPGDGATIRIRGESSISASNDPLIVIDGVPIDNGGVSGGRNPLNIINPNDIESFTVLKDASAAAIYGNRAAGGVILITTKKGSVGSKLRIGYNGNFSVSKATDFVDVLNANEYRDLVMSLYDSTHRAVQLLGDANTDWQQEIYQTAIGHDHNLYASGGVANIPYRVSLGYTDKQGILKTDEFRRITTGLNLNPGLLDNTLQINFHFKGMFTENTFADRGAIGNSLSFDPTQPIRDPESPYGGFYTWRLNNSVNPNNIGAPRNPVALLELRDDQSDERRYITNLSADYRLPFLPALRANLNLAYDFSHGEGRVIVPPHAAFAFNASTGGGVNNTYEQDKKNSLLEFYLNYKTQLTKHSIDLMGGYSWQHFWVESQFRNSDTAGTPSETQSDTVGPAEYYLISFFGRLNYSFDDRFLLTLSLRNDGTSRFAPGEYRWGVFPAAALAVKILDEDRPVFNSLKLRLGYGITGQQEIGDYYAYLARYVYGNESARYQFGEDFVTTIRPNGYDADIHWEETETYNAGLDFSIIRDRLAGTLEVYKRNTTDLLNEVPVPAGTNLTNFITTNVANMENYGVEITLNTTPIMKNKVRWDFSVNAAYNEGEITRLRRTDDPDYEGVLVGGIAGGVGSTIQIYTVGFAPRAFYVYEQLYDENGELLENMFADRNNDGVINDMDQYRYEKPAADYTFGFTSRLEVGNFDFSFAGRASTGNFVYNNVQTDMGWLGRVYLSTGGPALWNVHQSAVDLNVENQSSLTLSDHFVKKADYLKVDHVTVGYNFDNVVGRFLRLYATMQNVVTVTDYDGLDPEVFSGIDNNIYPRPRTIVFGLNVEF